jgi:hypothetical protein
MGNSDVLSRIGTTFSNRHDMINMQVFFGHMSVTPEAHRMVALNDFLPTPFLGCRFRLFEHSGFTSQLSSSADLFPPFTPEIFSTFLTVFFVVLP